MPNWKHNQEPGYHKKKVSLQDIGQSCGKVSIHVAFSTVISSLWVLMVRLLLNKLMQPKHPRCFNDFAPTPK